MNLELIKNNGKKPKYVNVNTYEVTNGGDRSGMRINSPGPDGFYIKKKGPDSTQAEPEAAAAESYSPAQRSQGTSSINFDKQLADIKAQNQASIDALTSQLTDQKADYEAKEIAANKRISNLSSTVANAQSQYDPTKGLGSSNNINPALTIQEKNKSLSSGTQRYNRSKLSINNLNV